MTRRAARGPMGRTFDLLLAVAAGSAVILLGCGGGGGGGGNNNGGGGGGSQVCGSAVGSQAVVLCGTVVTADANQSAVPGATVTLKDASGTTVTSGGVPVTTTTNANGRFQFDNVPSNAALFEVEGPSTAYYQNLVLYNNGSISGLYSFTNKNQANTGFCFPALPTLTPGDHWLGPTSPATAPGIGVYPNSAPPPPPFGCPR